jgi:drug/metabolite transporter (DMT)-like permease
VAAPLIAKLRELSPARQGHLAMLAFSGLVAGSFALGSRIANQVDPVAMNAVRFAIAGTAVGVVALATSGLPKRAPEAPWRFLILGGFFGFYFVAMFEGLKTAEPVSAAAVFTLTPIMTAGFGYLLLRQNMTQRMALALAVGAAGALWVIFDADPGAALAFDLGRGEWIYFLGCIAHALYPPLARLLNRGEPVAAFTFGMMLSACLLLVIVGWNEVQATDWAALPGVVWATIFYLALGASSITFLLLFFATLRLPAAKVMAYTYLTPSWVILWELALGGSVPAPVLLVGVALTVIALWLLLKDEHPVS